MFNEKIYQLQINVDGEITNCSTYGDFLYKIRRVNKSNFLVKIAIVDRCESPWITLDSQGLYLTKIGAINFPEVYTEADTSLSLESLIAAVKVAASAAGKNQHTNYTLPDAASKVLAFFISEAARFEIVEHAAYVMFNDQNTQFSWKDWKPLLNNWLTLSEKASVHFTFKSDKPQVRPVPISSSQKNTYEPERAAVHYGSNLTELQWEVESKYLAIESAVQDDDTLLADGADRNTPQ